MHVHLHCSNCLSAASGDNSTATAGSLFLIAFGVLNAVSDTESGAWAIPHRSYAMWIYKIMY